MVAPSIWRSIKGAEKLLFLIEGVATNPNHTSRAIDITLPEPLSDVALLRFRIYAPFVRHLEIFKDQGSDYAILNSKSLLDLSLSSPLLPNLLSFTASNSMWFLNDQRSQLPLLLMFQSPSLLEYRAPYDTKRRPAMVTQPRFTAILSALQRHCPNLRTLELYGNGSLYSNESELPLVPLDYELAEYFRSANLSSLSTSLSVLKAIGDLASISQIERLEMFSFGHVQSIDELPSFQNVQWPKLRHLTLYLISGMETFFCLWQLHSLVADLTSFKLSVGGFRSRHIEATVDRVATLLAEQSPNLTNVSFCQSPLTMPGTWLDPAPVIPMLSKLPVRRLRIDVGDRKLRLTSLKGHLSGHTFNSIRSLDLGAYCIGFKDLESFAQSTPILTYLRIQLWVSFDGEETACSTTCNQALQLHVCFVKLSAPEPTVAWEAASRCVLGSINAAFWYRANI
ncbi:hypothetical protein FRC08_002567 [Ceratobasidium sp. 394]|nr:hypothetical protein FRC08_002567 [Ceratobasidium sp. 394]